MLLQAILALGQKKGDRPAQEVLKSTSEDAEPPPGLRQSKRTTKEAADSIPDKGPNAVPLPLICRQKAICICWSEMVEALQKGPSKRCCAGKTLLEPPGLRVKASSKDAEGEPVLSPTKRGEEEAKSESRGKKREKREKKEKKAKKDKKRKEK